MPVATTNSTEADSAGRVAGIDLLRGVAIIGIVLFHLWGFTTHGFGFSPNHRTLLHEVRGHALDVNIPSTFTAAWEIIFRSGRDGVTLFIMLSGIALTLMATRRGAPPNALDFYTHRFGRILRAYWAGFAIVLLSLALLAVPKMLIDGGSFYDNWRAVGHVPYFDGGQLIAGLTIVPRGFRLEWFVAPPNPLWFVFLLLQYYLLFPYLQRIADRFGYVALLLASLVVSVGSTALLIGHYNGRLDIHGWIVTIWFPFRLFEFALGMTLGFLVFRRAEAVRRVIDGSVKCIACVLSGVAIYLTGVVIYGNRGYSPAFSFPLIAIGLTCMSLPLLFKRPGRAEASTIGRVLLWIGPMSLPVLIMNEPFRFIDHYIWFKGYVWSPGWWLYVVVLYVPGTLVLAALLSRLLGLTPPDHAMQLLRRRPLSGLESEQSVLAPSTSN